MDSYFIQGYNLLSLFILNLKLAQLGVGSFEGIHEVRKKFPSAVTVLRMHLNKCSHFVSTKSNPGGNLGVPVKPPTHSS